MINLEQIKLLETKVARAIDYIEQLGKENASLRQKETDLQTRLKTYQDRIDELEVLIMRFKEDQGRIEAAILDALERFNQFEEAVEKSLWDKPSGIQAAGARAGRPKSHQAEAQHVQAESSSPSLDEDEPEDADALEDASEPEDADAPEDASGEGKTCFEIPAYEADDDIPDPVSPLEPLDAADSSPEKSGELDIF